MISAAGATFLAATTVVAAALPKSIPLHLDQVRCEPLSRSQEYLSLTSPVGVLVHSLRCWAAEVPRACAYSHFNSRRPDAYVALGYTADRRHRKLRGAHREWTLRAYARLELDQPG